MSRVESPVQAASAVMPYTVNDKQQFLVDAVKSGNIKLVQFLLYPQGMEIPSIFTEEDLDFQILLNAEETAIAWLEEKLVEEVYNFVVHLSSQEKSAAYDQGQLFQELGRFLSIMGKSIKEDLFNEKMLAIQNQLPRLKNDERDADGNELPDFEACIPFFENNRTVQANYAQICAYYEDKYTCILQEHGRIFRQLLQPLQLPLIQSNILEIVKNIYGEKQSKTEVLEEQTSKLNSQKLAAQSRQAFITVGLDGEGFMYIEMLGASAALPSYFQSNKIFLRENKKSDTDCELIAYWSDPKKNGSILQKSLSLADFNGIELPEPGKELKKPNLFRVITSKFGCVHFDNFNYFGENVPERLRATSYEDRERLARFTLSKDLLVLETQDTLAHIAAKAGRYEMLKLLFDNDSNGFFNRRNIAGNLPVNAQDENGDTLLHRAIRERKFDQIIWLLQHSADTQILNRDQKAADICAIVDPETGDTLAHIAAKNGDMPALRFLVEYNNGVLKKKENKEFVLPMNVQDEAGNTLLHKAVRSGELADVRWLLEQSADVYLLNAESKYALDQCILATGETLLERALANQDEVSFDFYLECGVDPLIENAQHQTILDVLFIQGRNRTISKELAVRFLELFITYFRSLSPIDIWPNNRIRAVQKFIRQEYEVYIKKGLYKIFEFYLNDVKEFIMSYMEKQLLPRIKSNWLAERPAMARLLGQHKRFEFRWSDCVDVLKALRDSVKAESPILLSERLEDIKKRFEDDQNDKRERTGPLGHSEFWEFLEYATRTYHLRVRLLEFEVLRDEMLDVQRAIEQREADRQLEVKKLNDQIASLQTELATYKSALEEAHKEIAATKKEAAAAKDEAAAAKLEAAAAKDEAINTRKELGDKLQEMQDQAQQEKADLKEQLNATEERSRQAQEELKEQLSAISRQAQADREENKKERDELKAVIKALMEDRQREREEKREREERERQDKERNEREERERQDKERREEAVSSATPDFSDQTSQSSGRGVSISSEPVTPGIGQNPHSTFASPADKKPAVTEAMDQGVDNPAFV